MYRVLKKHRTIIIPFLNLLVFCFTQIVLNEVAGEGCFMIYILKMYICVCTCVCMHICTYVATIIYTMHIYAFAYGCPMKTQGLQLLFILLTEACSLSGTWNLPIRLA